MSIGKNPTTEGVPADPRGEDARPVSILGLKAPASCSNCDAEDGIRWHVQGFISTSFKGRARVSAYLGCDNCGETITLIEYAEEDLEAIASVAMSAPVRALAATWDAVVPHLQPCTLADMGNDEDEPDLTALREALSGMSMETLTALGVVAHVLQVETHKARDAKFTVELRGKEANHD